MSQKLIQHQIVNYTDVLKWLRKILECRNQFLKRHRSYANMGSQIAICRQAHIKMEVQLLLEIWRKISVFRKYSGGSNTQRGRYLNGP